MSPRDSKRSEYTSLIQASSIAWMFPLAIIIGFIWGWYMDKWFGTWPWLTAIFSVFGIIAAFLNLFRIAVKDNVAPPSDKQNGG